MDWNRREGGVGFDEALEPTFAPEDPRPYGAMRTYSTSFLCAHEDRVALLLNNVDGPLDGLGQLLLLERSGPRWELVWATMTWAS